jgi:hypothetical protein
LRIAAVRHRQRHAPAGGIRRAGRHHQRLAVRAIGQPAVGIAPGAGAQRRDAEIGAGRCDGGGR